MKEQEISKIYALAVIEVAEKDNVDIALELTKLQEVINSSNDLENLLFLEIYTIEEKKSVLGPIAKRLGLSKLVENFLTYIVQEKRISLLPMIYKEVIVHDDNKKGFLRVVVEGVNQEINSKDKEVLLAYLKKQLNKDAKMEYVQNSELGAGYRITAGDLQLDASLINSLNSIKNKILGE